MKKFFITFCLISFLFSIYELHSQSLKDHLVAYWSFDDETARDQSGNHYDGIIVNTPTFVSGVNGVGKAIRLQGRGDRVPDYYNLDQIGDHILLPKIPLDTMKEFSISIWIKEEGFSYIHGEVYIWFGIQQNGWLGIAHSAPNPDTTLYVNYSVGANDFIDGPYLRLFDYGTRNSWMFYSLVYSNGYINAYLNGKWIGSKQQNLKFSSNFAAIGRHWWFDVDNLTIVNTSARFTGSVDDVRIYNIALTNDEVDSLYNNTFSDVESLNSTLIDNNSIDRISVYPNPATTYTKVSYIRSTSNFISSISAEIVDQFGRIVAECQSKSSEQNNINDKIFGKVEFYFNTDELSNGLYAIIVNDNNNLYSTKLIINK